MSETNPGYLDYAAMRERTKRYRRHANNGNVLALEAAETKRKVEYEAMIARMLADLPDEREIERMMMGDGDHLMDLETQRTPHG